MAQRNVKKPKRTERTDSIIELEPSVNQLSLPFLVQGFGWDVVVKSPQTSLPAGSSDTSTVRTIRNHSTIES